MAIAVEQALPGSTPDQNSVVLTSWSPAANELLLIFVASRRDNTAHAVSGNGLTWVNVTTSDVVNVQTALRISLWRAMSSSTPTAGSITVTITSNIQPIQVVALRISGVDTGGSNGSAAIEATATNTGPAIDNNDLKIDLATATANAWATAFGSHRGTTITLSGSDTEISINNTAGIGAAATTASIWRQSVASPTTVTLGADNDLSANNDWAAIAVSLKPAGGTAHSVTVSGSLTPAGALVKTTMKALAGALTPTGAIIFSTTKLFAGSVTPAGTLTKTTSKPLTGSVTPSGALSVFKTTLVTLAGALTPSGDLLKTTTKVLAGVLTPEGALDAFKTFLVTLTGALTPSGALVRTTTKTLAGALTPTGDLARTITKILAGALTPSGALVKSTTKALAGNLTPTGAIARTITKVLAGALTFIGSLSVTGGQAAGLIVTKFRGMFRGMFKGMR